MTDRSSCGSVGARGLGMPWPGASWMPRWFPEGPHQASTPTPEPTADRQPSVQPDVPDVPNGLDRLFHATMGRLTAGLSPAALWLAFADWSIHLSQSPGKCQQLVEKGFRKAVRFGNYAVRLASDPACPSCIEPLSQDERFRDPLWRETPFNLIHQGFLLHQQWWHCATTGVGGVSRHREQLVSFMVRQGLDMLSPSNFIAMNPEVLATTVREGGLNLLHGGANAWVDWERLSGGKPPAGTEAFRPGETVAVTRGEVVMRNRLIELIQYAPATGRVHPEPILIVPAWIMKFYILDLSPRNSLVRHLVDAGYSDFMISWHNPTGQDRDLALNDYLHLGILDALAAVRTIIPGARVNAVGYCLGGTLLAIAAAYLTREERNELRSITLLAVQTDFADAGELSLFIDESQVDYLEDLMWEQGYPGTRRMSGAFQLLRSNDPIWSRIVRHYLLGRRTPMTDLMAWNADTPRMPYRMHSEYLRRLFLSNDLFEGRYEVDGRPVALRDIHAPLFVVAAERDHVAPWRSVFKINLMNDTDITFLLTTGGYNAGILSEPGRAGRSLRMTRRPAGTRYVDPDSWFAAASPREGSWWAAWVDWLDELSGAPVELPAVGALAKGYAPLGPAPGRYVLKR